MTVLAGIDVGNSTTELLLAQVGEGHTTPLHAVRAGTVGEKGSEESLVGAARLLRRAEQQSGLHCDAVAIADLHPVRTLVAEFPRVVAAAAPLRTLTAAGASTPSGSGLVHGSHVFLQNLDGIPVARDVITSVPRDVDFEDASRTIASALSRGWHIVGVLVEADEAVLIGNRLPAALPIVDEAAVDQLAEGGKIALEVAGPGESVAGLNDPVTLAALFDLPPSSIEAVAPLARSLSDARATAVTTSSPESRRQDRLDEGWIEFAQDGQTVRLSLAGSHKDVLRRLPPGAVRSLHAPLGSALHAAVEGYEELVRDLCISDLPGLRERSSVRRGSAYLDAAPVSVYIERSSAAHPETILRESSGRPVFVVSSESQAARLGALTTPAAPPDATVCDIGGGTIDVVGEWGGVVAAGAGELLTISVAFALGLTRGLAEYVKRSPSVRVETPHLVHHEDGSRDFLVHPAPGRRGRESLLAATRRPATVHRRPLPEEWRALRLSIKAQVIIGNLERCLDKLAETPKVVLLCGGAAHDKELVRIVNDWIGARGATAGRTNVSARFGPRYAVALGLVLFLAEQLAAGSVGCSVADDAPRES